MAELSENATYAEIRTSYRRNASYEEDASVVKARRFVTAIRYLLAMPMRTRKGNQGGGEVEFDVERLQAELVSAQMFIQGAATSSSPDVLDADFSGFDSRT